MITTAIIAEFNPFHNGHAYLFERAKALTNADRLVVVMSGDFVQRGEPAIMDKHLRARIALDRGADLVLELPVCYATASAEYFAYGAVTLLDRLGTIDYLCFGSETGDLTMLSELADILCEEPALYQEELNRQLKCGNAFPVARKLALATYLKQTTSPDNTAFANGDMSFLDTPNNILALEYLKALKKQHSSIKPVTVKRTDSGYHSNALTEETGFASASALRALFSEHASASDSNLWSQIAAFVPKTALPILTEAFYHVYPVLPADFDQMLQYKLMMEDDFTIYLDVTGDFHDKLMKYRTQFQSSAQFIHLLKSKDLTFTRISRMLSHILLGITKAEMDSFINGDVTYYATMFALSKSASDLTGAIKANSKLPLISSASKAERILTKNALKQFQKDLQTAHLYESVVARKFGQEMQSEYTRMLISQ